MFCGTEDRKAYGNAFKTFATQAVLLAIAGLCVALDLMLFRNMNENGIVEMTQISMLIFSSFTFFANARANKPLRIPLVILGAIFASAILRENDGPLDVLLFHGAWKFLCLPIWIATAAYVALNFRKTVAQCAAYSRTASFNYILMGMLIVGCFAQAVSYKGLWYGLIPGVPDEEIRAVKNIAQEMLEILGYSIVVVGALAIDAERPKAEPQPNNREERE